MSRAGCCVGVATTKTLAKLANRLAKRVPINAGVCVLTTPGTVTEALSSVELTDLWGVSHGFARRLAGLGIHSPLELRDADPSRVRA